jgi:phage terminase small subunit
MSEKKSLTPMQSLFVQEYLIDLNATQAAIRAGYSEKTANEQGSRLLANVSIASAVKDAINNRSKVTGITSEKVLKRLDDIGDIDISEAYDDKGHLLPIHEMPIHIRKSIASIKVFDEYEGFGKDRIKIGEVREVKFYDKVRANELIGKHLKMFTEKVELTGKDGASPVQVIITLPSNGRESKIK